MSGYVFEGSGQRINEKYDVIVVGAGHNSLTSAAYLARQGMQIAILEKNSVIGGCASTEELWPGFRNSVASYVFGIFSSEIIRDLDLERHGLRVIDREPYSYTPDLNGPGLLLGRDLEFNKSEIRHYSKADADAIEMYEAHLDSMMPVLSEMIDQIPPNLYTFGKNQNPFEIGREICKAAEASGKFISLGRKLPSAYKLITGSAMDILDEWFESDILRATLCTDGVIGSMVSPYTPGSAYVLFHHVMGEAGSDNGKGERGIWGLIEGGMGGLASALERSCLETGNVDIFRETRVKKIWPNDGKDNVVFTEDEGCFVSKVVVSGVDANLTFNKFLSPNDLPEGFRKAVNRISYSSPTAKINLALDSLPTFVGGRGIESLHGTIHISPTVDFVEQAFQDAKTMDYSKNPLLEITIPSVLDPTLVDVEGTHVAGILVQYMGEKIKRDWTDREREAFFNTCMTTLEQYSPGFAGKVLHKQVLTPVDLEEKFGLTNGNIFQGNMNISNLGPLRPVLGYANHRTPIKGLYLCGSAAHPGGGVTGIPGRNAAQVILSDMAKR